MRRLLLGELRADPFALDGDTADRLLAGRLDSADAPPGYAEVATVLAAAAGPPTPGELAGQAAAIARFSATRCPSAGPRRQRAARHRRAFGSRLPVLAAAALSVLLLGGVAAAATGTLPGPARWVVDSVSQAAHHLPARSAHTRQDPGTVRSGREGADGAASVGHAGSSQQAHAGQSAHAAPTGPGATGAARGSHCGQPLAARAGVNGCKDVKPEQVRKPAHGSQSGDDGNGGANPSSSSKPESKPAAAPSAEAEQPAVGQSPTAQRTAAATESAPVKASTAERPSSVSNASHRQKESAPLHPTDVRH
jgi:hypothetical protein